MLWLEHPPGEGLGLAAGVGGAEGDALALGLALGEATTPLVDGPGRLSGLATNSTPTIKTAMTHAATPAIQYGARHSGAWVTAERTRSWSPAFGEPLTSSNALFSSRRKFSLLTSEHLLDREVGSQSLGGAIDARFGCRGRHAQGLRQLFERKVEIEMEDERQALVG